MPTTIRIALSRKGTRHAQLSPRGTLARKARLASSRPTGPHSQPQKIAAKRSAIGETLTRVGMPYIIIEQNRETAEALRAKGLPVLYGDATRPGVLREAHVDQARLLIVATPDPFQSRAMIDLARDLPSYQDNIHNKVVQLRGELAAGQDYENLSRDARALRDTLVTKGWVLGQDLAYMEAEGAQHNEASWGSRIDSVLRFLFPLPKG